MPDDDDFDAVRQHFLALARKGCWVDAWSKKVPKDWRPTKIWNPAVGQYFTRYSARQFIFELLEQKYPMERIELTSRKGHAYVMHVQLDPKLPPLYIKLQLGSGAIICLSFHYSER